MTQALMVLEKKDLTLYIEQIGFSSFILDKSPENG